MKHSAVLLLLLILLAGCLVAGCTSLAPQTDAPIVQPSPNNIPTTPPTTAPDTTQIVLPATSVVPVEPALEGVTACMDSMDEWGRMGHSCNYFPDTTIDQLKITYPALNSKYVMLLDGDHTTSREEIHSIYEFQKMKKLKIQKCEQGVGTVLDCARCGVTLDRDNGNVIKFNLSDRSYWCGHDY